ncbi:hypothetical protein TBR22_A47500 [Luteitalea sp. TBR-22]|nr:hypothetical protein TBR22_A47500 [Luteitalea sp. TBR-22]
MRLGSLIIRPVEPRTAPKLATMLVLPSATAVTIPPFEIVAAAEFSDDHCAELVRSSVAPVDRVTVAVN